MKTFLWITAAVILGLIALSSMGPIIGFLIGLLIAYYALKQFKVADSTVTKVIWSVVGLIGISISLKSLPGFIGILAVYFLYKGYKHWKKTDDGFAQEKKDVFTPEKNDPFAGFEHQWKELKNNKA